ncbi:gliding motility-associated C-terminal domain-containing protein [Flavobacterium sufflavum]|uniref:Gliding motility-associated C-terminal domain-containing protein n=1 Tax=Flavobacterium sufflavum TaxID=1921138 RepID=A0A3S2V3H4_9FLAO|nr:gliding motility-associated C-terminal domain-containing protein [Flavobacterium sufflavum]RVT75274.1 gliding motility-associated C-terminal domain-containing protein [Flavobacterium sufflavum]
MMIKLLCFIKNNFIKFSILFLFLLSSNSYSQCAGSGNTITICDIQNPVNSNINLFSLLGGSPTAGGVWIDNSKPLEESIFNGILDVQKIKNSGVYTYTYVQDPSVCTNNTATITVNIGPYSGVPSPNVSTCDDVESFNLFSAFDGTKIAPQQNGTWKDSNGVVLLGNTINPKTLGEGNYSYTYTVPALATCPAQSATVFITVFRKPVSGVASNLILCSTDNLALYKNLNLHDRLSNEDAGGRWADVSGTNQITSTNDNKIDVENIYNTRGAGIYSFVYTVLSSNPICNNTQSTVLIVIEEPLNFTGSTLVVNSDICENEIATATYTATLRKGPQAIPDGNYDVSYRISNGTTTNNITVNGNFVNGTFTFNVNSIYLQAVGNYTFTITNIINKASRGACSNILGTISDVLTISPLPKINTATIKIDPICKGLAAQVEISGNTNLSNGTYRINYNLSGDNTATNQQLDITVTNGVALFSIPANLIPNVGTNTTFSITNITNLTTGCTNTSTLSKVFTVKALPNVAAVTVNANNICLAQTATVQLSGLGSLTNITVDYSLTGTNTLSNQTVTLTVNAGNASFTIPASALVNAGNTTVILNSILDNSNGCSAVALNKTKSFLVNSIPTNPATNSFSFCKNDLKTIANLTPSGSQYQWFDSVSSTTALSASTILVTGNYYVKEVNSTTGCESGRTVIAVTINESDAPILATDGQNFCGLDQPKVQDLSNRTTVDDALVWFDALQNGNQLAANVLLKDGMTYYGYNFTSSTNCYSNALEVTISLSNCDVTPDFFTPDGFSPNGDMVNDTFRIPKIEFIYPDFALEIFDRYGNVLFKGNKNKLEWDGKNSDYKIGIDGIAPNGVYFYVLHLNKGNKKPVQGKLYLNR